MSSYSISAHCARLESTIRGLIEAQKTKHNQGETNLLVEFNNVIHCWHQSTSEETLREDFRVSFALLNEVIQDPDLSIRKRAHMLNAFLIDAAEWDAPLVVRTIIRSGADVNYSNFSGETPLNRAIDARRKETVSALLRYGAHINKLQFRANLPLAAAAAADAPDLIRLLISKGADINAHGWSGRTALGLAARTDSIQAIMTLIECGADADARGEGGLTPLMHAAVAGNWPSVEVLIKHGADPDAVKAADGRSFDRIAIDAGQERIRRLVRSMVA
jgi:ankyrin repeat protein